MCSTAGSTACAAPDAHADWFGQPSHASDLPAVSEDVPGQSAGASFGILLFIVDDMIYLPLTRTPRNTQRVSEDVTSAVAISATLKDVRVQLPQLLQYGRLHGYYQLGVAFYHSTYALTACIDLIAPNLSFRLRSK